MLGPSAGNLLLGKTASGGKASRRKNHPRFLSHGLPWPTLFAQIEHLQTTSFTLSCQVCNHDLVFGSEAGFTIS